MLKKQKKKMIHVTEKKDHKYFFPLYPFKLETNYPLNHIKYIKLQDFLELPFESDNQLMEYQCDFVFYLDEKNKEIVEVKDTQVENGKRQDWDNIKYIFFPKFIPNISKMNKLHHLYFLIACINTFFYSFETFLLKAHKHFGEEIKNFNISSNLTHFFLISYLMEVKALLFDTNDRLFTHERCLKIFCDIERRIFNIMHSLNINCAFLEKELDHYLNNNPKIKKIVNTKDMENSQKYRSIFDKLDHYDFNLITTSYFCTLLVNYQYICNAFSEYILQRYSNTFLENMHDLKHLYLNKKYSYNNYEITKFFFDLNIKKLEYLKKKENKTKEEK